MDASIILARLIGPLFLVVGVGVLLNRAHYRNMIGNFLGNAGLYYFAGATALAVGVAMVSFHNVWTADWRVAITVLGWLSVVKGTILIVFPSAGARLAKPSADVEWPLPAGAALILGLGAWLSYEGYRL